MHLSKEFLEREFASDATSYKFKIINIER